MVEANLRSLVEIAGRRRLQTALQQSLDQTARHVVERTSELQDANTALRVLLGNVEQSNEARNEQLLQQINTLVTPHVAKLARLVERDSAAVEYVSLIETNLTTLTSSLSSRMVRVFQALTATEADVAHLVMRGLTTKDIAATLSRAPRRVPETGHRTGERTAQQHGVFPLITTRDVLVYPSSRRVCSMAST